MQGPIVRTPVRVPQWQKVLLYAPLFFLALVWGCTVWVLRWMLLIGWAAGGCVMDALGAWFCTRAHRQRVGGVWYYVKDQSAGWCARGWTQEPTRGDGAGDVYARGLLRTEDWTR